MRQIYTLFILLGLLIGCAPPEPERGDPLDHTPDQEGYYYQLITLPIPDDVVLEVGGLDILEDGRPAVSTRRGEVWIVNDAYGDSPTYQRYASGLHEPLGLLEKDGDLYTAQRGELTRMVDEDGDGRADLYETVYAWPLTGNYHEYSYGPLLLPNGNFFVSLNLGWVGYGASLAKWRGWALEITPGGEAIPMAVGFRSPAGIGITAAGDIFYGENQGDWIGSGWISHIEKGDFLGHPGGLAWSDDPASPIRLTMDDVPNTGEPMFAAKEEVPQLKLPTVWFPHTIMGISTSAIIEDQTGGDFGPFAGQLFVGDQGHSKLMRVYLEKVNGVYQGVVFPFYEGFSSGILRTAWGEDHSLFVGQTSRGWDATGKQPYALERLKWTGIVPFEMKEVKAEPDGFTIVFTQPIDPESASDAANYGVSSFIYKYHNTYGSPAINIEELAVQNVDVAGDGLSVKLSLGGLRAGYIHEIKLGGIQSQAGIPLLHDVAYYTLNHIPGGTSRSSAVNSSETASASTKRVTEMPVEWGGGPDQTVTVGTLPGLRFDVSTIEVQAGSKVALRFDNNDDMLHNVLITSLQGVDGVIAAAMELGIRGQEMGYVPSSDDVLFHTGLLQPESSETIYFTAPATPGEYAFVCTFPGHGATMRGVFIVTPR